MPDPTYQIQLFNEIRDRCITEFPERIAQIITMSVGPDGETFGDTHMSPGERIARMMLDATTGQQDFLEHINPKYAGKKARQFIEDMKHSPFIAHTYEGQKAPPPPPVPPPLAGENIWPTKPARGADVSAAMQQFGGLGGVP